MTVIAVCNESTVATDAQVDLIARAANHQVRYDFAPAWGRSASVVFIAKGQTPPASDILLHVKDTSDQPGALGYHDDQSVVEAFAFAKTDHADGADLGVTITHEILELLADPDCQRGEQHPTSGYWYALEVGDPVEADSDGYTVHVRAADGSYRDVLVSNFILPDWYKPGSAGPWDHQRLLTKPLQVRPYGYVSIWKGTGQWTQYQAQKTADAGLWAPGDQEMNALGFRLVESKSPRQRVRGEL